MACLSQADERPLQAVDAAELEDHLRNQIDTLVESGLEHEEAFLVAIKRIGSQEAISREFAQEYSERLWKQLVNVEKGEETGAFGRAAWAALSMPVVAAIVTRLCLSYGLSLEGDAGASFMARNAALFVLPPLTAYFAWTRRVTLSTLPWLVIPFILAVIVINTYPFQAGGHTEILAALHLPIVLWSVVGFAYSGGHWRDHALRMDFVRFTGEWFIYFVLIALGGGVLMMFTMLIFSAINYDAEWLLEQWILPCGAAGAVVIAAWLVEAKQSVVENMAPVLTRLFTPLFTILLAFFLATMIWTSSSIDVERQLLIGFDLLLVLVLGLVLYAISARDKLAPAGMFDRIQFTLIVLALIVDVFALAAITMRISDFGVSPNKIAALGENLVLLVNLAGAGLLYSRFIKTRIAFPAP